MNTDNSSLEFDQSEVTGIKSNLVKYTRYWYVFLAGAILSLSGAYSYLRYIAVPQFSMQSTLLIKDDKSGQGLSNADAFTDLSMFKSTKSIDNEIQVLKSSGLMQRVISELGLAVGYYVDEPVRTTELYGSSLPIKMLIQRLDSNATGKQFTIDIKSSNSFELDDHEGHITSNAFGQQIQKPYGIFTIIAIPLKKFENKKIIIRIQDIKKIANHYNKSVTIQPPSKIASVLQISLVDPVPEKAKNIINKLVSVYNNEAIEDKNLMASNTLAFLDERLKYVTSELSNVEKGVEQYKSANGLTDIGTQASNYTAQASDYNKQLSEWATQIEVLESIERYMRKEGSQYSMVPSTLGISDPTLLGLIGKFNELQQERERMLRTILPNNPLVQNLNEQLANLRVNILENLHNIKVGLEITSTNLRVNSGRFQSQIKHVPAMERKIQDIIRQQAIKQNIYVYLLQKREETALSLAATTSAARVIDSATGGNSPISPNDQETYFMALLLGLGIPFAGIYARNVLNNRVQTIYDVSAITAAPIIGEIGNNQFDTVVVTEASRSAIAEMFRLVRANLNFVTLGKENIVLLVTSSMSGEGKTFFSINLSASLALTGKRIALIDLDLRNSKMAKDLGLPIGPGITDYLLGTDILINDIIQFPVKTPNLSVIVAGSLPPNPAELLLSPKLRHLIHELKDSFDYIIIDSPPVGQVADGFTLNSFIDFSVYLVRYNYTYKSQLYIIKNIFNNKTLNQPMLVLNDAKEVNGTNYGYGYGYGYDQKNIKKNKSVG